MQVGSDCVRPVLINAIKGRAYCNDKADIIRKQFGSRGAWPLLNIDFAGDG